MRTSPAQSFLRGACIVGLLVSPGCASTPSQPANPPPDPNCPASAAPPAPTSPTPSACPDFWIGAWTANIPAGGTLPNGSKTTTPVKAADAAFKPLFDGCTYLERWDTVPMADGKSRRGIGIHRRDPATGAWSQTWIDNQGAEHTSEGQDFERGVRYSPTAPPADGALRRQTIVPQPGGAVRNYGEVSKDSGQTWQVEFEFNYTRK